MAVDGDRIRPLELASLRDCTETWALASCKDTCGRLARGRVQARERGAGSRGHVGGKGGRKRWSGMGEQVETDIYKYRHAWNELLEVSL
jgi:hypothetical protein